MAWGLGTGLWGSLQYSKKVDSINYCRKNSTTKTSQYTTVCHVLCSSQRCLQPPHVQVVYISRRAEQLLKEVLLPRGRPEVVLVREEPNL